MLRRLVSLVAAIAFCTLAAPVAGAQATASSGQAGGSAGPAGMWDFYTRLAGHRWLLQAPASRTIAAVSWVEPGRVLSVKSYMLGATTPIESHLAFDAARGIVTTTNLGYAPGNPASRPADARLEPDGSWTIRVENAGMVAITRSSIVDDSTLRMVMEMTVAGMQPTTTETVMKFTRLSPADEATLVPTAQERELAAGIDRYMADQAALALAERTGAAPAGQAGDTGARQVTARALVGRAAARMSDRDIQKYADSTHQRCRAADLEACAEFGRLHVPLPEDDSALVVVASGKRKPRDVVDGLTRACDSGGSAISCVRLGMALRATTKESRWSEPGGAIARIEEGCAQGAGAGCVERAEAVPAWPMRNWAVKGQWLEKGCALGALRGCATAGHLYSGYFVGMEGAVPVDTAKAITNYDGACSLGDRLSCLRLGPLLLAGGVGVAPDTARATELLRDACRGAMVPSCMALGELMISHNDSSAARAAFDRACDIRHVAGCERLAATVSTLPGSTAAEEALARAAAARAAQSFGPIAAKAGHTYLYRSKDQRYAFRMAIDVLRDGRALVLDEGLDVGKGLLLIAVDGSPELRVTSQEAPDRVATGSTYRARRQPNGDLLVWYGDAGKLYRAEANRIRKQPVIIGADGSIREGMKGAAQTPGNDGWWSDYYPSSEAAYASAAAIGVQRQQEVRNNQGRGVALLGAAMGAAAGAYVGADAATTAQMMAAGAAAGDPNSAVSRGLSAAAGAASPAGTGSAAAGGAGGGRGAVQPGSYPTRPLVAGLAAACPGFTEENYPDLAFKGGSDTQLFTMCGQAYDLYNSYKNAIRQGYAESDANRTYDAHAKAAAVAIGFRKG